MRDILRHALANKVIQAVIFVLFLWLLYEIRMILIILLFAFIIMSGMKPLIAKLEGYRWPRPLAVLSPYFGLFVFIAFASYSILPMILSQLRKLAASLPDYVEQATEFFNTSGLPINNVSNTLSELIEPSLNSILFLPGAVAIFFVAATAILFISLYLLWDPNYLYSKVSWVGRNGQKNVVNKIESAMGMWLRGQIIIALIVGAMTLFGLTLLGVEFALTLAIITAILEFIPYVGPVIAAIIAMTVAVGHSWLAVGLVGALYFIIQQVESNVLVPQVMKRSVNLHPITIITSILVGSHFLGIVGALAAVPLATIATIVFEEIRLVYGKKPR
jgi:predicted PurR-regulated permease PerM